MQLVKATASTRSPREYALTVAGREVGALRAGTLRFHGYDSAESAHDAALRAGESLAGWYRERWHSTEPVAFDATVDPARAVRAGELVVGRLLAPGDRIDAHDAASVVPSHGFELRVPDHLWVATGLGLAQRIWTALTEEVAAA
jgi:hypothetical protein